MNPFERALGKIDGGLVLDIATGWGSFIETLAGNLRSFSQIFGVDLSIRMMAGAPESLDREVVGFAQMDAGRMGFGDGAFDTVSLSASLHHMADATPILAEITRVLKPGGCLIVAEMHRDTTTEAQMTSVLIHAWAAAVDDASGWPHYPTLSRQQITGLVDTLDLCDTAIYDWVDEDSDPQDKERIETLEGVFERYLPRAKELTDYAELEDRAIALRQRLRDTGAQDEPRVAIIALKPG